MMLSGPLKFSREDYHLLPYRQTQFLPPAYHLSDTIVLISIGIYFYCKLLYFPGYFLSLVIEYRQMITFFSLLNSTELKIHV